MSLRNDPFLGIPSGQRTRIKICGITCPEDAWWAVEVGVDAIGINFHPASPRCVSVDVARQIVTSIPPGVEVFALFVDRTADDVHRLAHETGIFSIQLHGTEEPEVVAALAPLRVLRAATWKNPQSTGRIQAYIERCQQLGNLPVGLLLDTHRENVPGGTGVTWDWQQARDVRFPLPVYLAGGLNPDNVAAAISALRPFGVDVASGVESKPGRKDRQRLRAFAAAVRTIDEQIHERGTTSNG